MRRATNKKAIHYLSKTPRGGNILNLAKVLEERRHLEEQIKSIDLELNQLPGKDFYCAKNGNSFKWYESDGKVSKYIPKKKRLYAEKLAKKKYLSIRKKDLRQEIIAIDFYLRHHNVTGKMAADLLSDPAYAELLSSYFKPVDQELQEWMNASYPRNELYPERLIHKTSAGINVRSKSEVLIVMLLHMKKIPFRYECLLKLGDTEYYPDFTVKHPRTGKIYYWEHFGKMDDANYLKAAFPKLQTYSNFGIIQGINLIATFETSEYPLEVDLIEKIIDYYFG